VDRVIPPRNRVKVIDNDSGTEMTVTINGLLGRGAFALAYDAVLANGERCCVKFRRFLRRRALDEFALEATALHSIRNHVPGDGTAATFAKDLQHIPKVLHLVTLAKPPSLSSPSPLPRASQSSSATSAPSSFSAASSSPSSTSGVASSGPGRLPGLVLAPVGKPLREVLSTDRARRERQALRITRDILHALRCAHQAGVTHGDVRPLNVVVVEGRAADAVDDLCAVLIDWGRSNSDDNDPPHSKGEMRADDMERALLTYFIMAHSADAAQEPWLAQLTTHVGWKAAIRAQRRKWVFETARGLPEDHGAHVLAGLLYRERAADGDDVHLCRSFPDRAYTAFDDRSPPTA
jgi:serine/threonine protein kinase